jgi:hypothetical protein
LYFSGVLVIKATLVRNVRADITPAVHRPARTEENARNSMPTPTSAHVLEVITALTTITIITKITITTTTTATN